MGRILSDLIRSEIRKKELATRILILHNINMKAKEFKYDVMELIQLVRERPCLWDKSCGSNSNKQDIILTRKAAWQEICSALEKNYKTMTRESQRLTESIILNKWKNIRDPFMKSLKNKRKNKYQYQLEFLVKNNPDESYSYSTGLDETDLHDEDDEGDSKCNVRKRSYDRNETEIGEDSTSCEEKKLRGYGNGPKSSDVDPDEGPSNYNISKISHNSYQDCTNNDVDNTFCEVKKKTKKDTKSGEVSQMFCEVNPESVIADYVGDNEIDPRVRNEAETFFASLLPSVVKYDEDDWLQFKIYVLKGMKKIRDKKH